VQQERLETIVGGLADRGWVVVPEFLTPAETAELAEQSRAGWEAGAFRHAGVGIGSSLRIDHETRRDYVHWLDETTLTAAQQAYFQRLEELRRLINRELQLGLFSFEGHFAVYPPGAFYKKHLDQFRNARHRVVSTILYLNSGWQQADGGELRLYLDETADGAHIDVVPYGGTLAVFLSARFYHEVLPARRERLSLTGWFRTRD
jgi:SM-20-related protein